MNLLIVDDEYYTVESISNKIRTLRPDFFEIFCAYNLTQALEIFSTHPIDLMICDIEMPGGSGLELLDQIRQAHYETVCIFLTAYAKFEYISRAMKLSSSDYLLKPLDDHALLEALDKACAQCEKQQKDRVNTLHANYWKESELPLAEQFFLDLLNGSISSAPSEVMDEIRYRRLNVELIHQPFCPLLIQTGQKSVFAASDNRTLYEFALKNIAREYFFEPGELPLTIRVLDGFYLLLLPASTHTRDSVVGRCRQALTDFVTHFPFSLNFFVFQKICLPESLLDAFLALKQFAAKNVTYENHVFDLAQETRTAVPASSQPIPSDRWSDLLLAGKTEQLQIEVFAFLNQLKSSGTATREFLTGFYYQFLQLLFRQMDHPGSEDEAFRRQITVASPEQTFSSFGALREWISNSLLLFTQSRQAAASQDTAVATVKAYIESHLSDELDRDTLAAMVYLNADYLSHLFKKDTGSSLINYIIDRRIAHSKELLAKGEMSIRDIAITCGFQNISYFSRQFKKSTGMTPRQFKN